MAATEEDEFKILQEFLSINEISEISNGICKKLEGFLRNKFDEFITAKAVFETNRKNLDKKLSDLTNNYQSQKEKLEKCQEKLNLTEKFSCEIQNQFDENRGELHRLQECVKRSEEENTELRKQKNSFIDENNILHSQVDRKDSELERLRTEFTSLSSQLQAAIAAKCQALAEIEEVRSHEMSLDFKEKRLEQERVLLSQQMVVLEEELSKRTNELQNTRSEASARALLTHTRLSQCEEELKITNDSIIQLREANSLLQRRCEELTQKLDDQRNHELIMHASYKEEVTAQIRLADLYKGMADEANAKADDYSNAVKELQDLLEHATEQYGILESKYNQTIMSHDEVNLEKQTKIDELTKELDLANELLKSIKQERLDQAIEQLAPTAAIASRILKKGLSLTQIYTQLVEATNELNLEKEENEKLKSQMEIILRELEEKAPILQQQREDYENAITNITTLSSRLDELLSENNNLQADTDEAKRLANHHNKENQRLKSELADLARQVCYLLKEVQETRIGNNITVQNSSMVDNDLASSQIISKKLVTFKDIEGLQDNNQKLLSIVRTLSSRQEEIEKATDEINSGEMKEKLDRYIEQLTEMQSAQERQTKMVEGLLKQRDMYKSMYQQCMNQTSNMKDIDKNEYMAHEAEGIQSKEMVTSNEYEQADYELKRLHKKLQDTEMRFNQVSSDFDIYRREKVAHEQMLNDEIERLRKDSEKNSARSCRLKAQLDSANERFSLLQANVVTYKSQIKILEEKCNNYTSTIGKHEQSLMILKDETLTAQSSLSKAEVRLENLRQERQLLRDSEGRLLKEREVLQRERHTSALLKADIEAIKTSLDRDRAEGQLRMEQRLDDASRECAALRRRLQEEQDRFRELSLNLERQISTIQDRLTEEKSLTERIQAELNASRLIEQEYIKRIDELNSKLKKVSTNTISKSVTGDENLNKQLKELEVQLASSQAEVKCLSDQLRTARFQGQQYCDIAESSELQLREATDQFGKSREELESNLCLARDEITSLQKKIKQMEDKLLKVSNGQHSNDSEIREKLALAERNLEELNELKGELELVKSDLQNASVAATIAEDKYAREMILHTADLQVLAKLKEENQIASEKISELILQKNSAKDTLIVEKSMWHEREKRLNDEIQKLQNRLEDLDTQNIILHNQIQELSEKTAIIQSQKQISVSGLQSPNTSFESINRNLNEEDSKSTEPLLQVMKYLRREKDLTIAKFDVLKSENMRLKSQAELSEKRIEEIGRLLERERENNEIHVVTASKHSELLRKVETLNAITDSNRILREERDSLDHKIKDLMNKINLLSEEIIPLREKSRDLEAKYESLLQENNSLKGEALRWRQRANTLVERANKASPDDWRRLQTERENLSKLLTSERETHTKRIEELNFLKNEKIRFEEQLNQSQRHLQSQEEQMAKMTDDIHKLSQDLNDSINNLNEKSKDITNLKKEVAEKDAMLVDLKNKEIQIRRIAKKYKTQYEELTKTMEEEKTRIEKNQSNQITVNKTINEDDSVATLEREIQLKEEGRLELRQANDQLNLKLDELRQQMLVMQSESENLKKEIEIINKVSLEKEERAKQVLKGARTKIMQLTEYKKLCEKEVQDLKDKLNTNMSKCESSINEYETRLSTLKSQTEARIVRLEHERSDLQAEKEVLLQRAAQLQRQLVGQSNISTGTNEPPTANIKPMSARTETPLASIRPMSVVVQSRTAAVLPTTAGAPLLLSSQQSQQQIVHTTETSSPTSSHMDYQPASTSRQLLVQPQLNDSAESTQREESEILDTQSIQQQQQQQQQCPQQTVALVSPRVEQQQLQQQQQQQQQQTLPGDQQQTVPSSSTQSVSTSHASVCHKRPRALDTSASASNLNESMDHTRQEQISSPKTKRSRQQDLNSTPASVSDIEYQVPTSSQRDQDEEGDDGCVVVDCDEGGGTHQAQEDEEFDHDPYEEIEEEEEIPYNVEVERDNNEVEIVMEEDSTSVEIPRQIPTGTPSNQQQQSEAISSAGPTGEPPSFTSRSSRGIAPMPRQQPQQHLLLPQQGYEDGGDDCIVPSTPTLFVPRRNDGFGESVSSPQVPQGRFTFGDPSASVSASSVQSNVNPTNCGTRTIFGSANSGLAQVVREGMDDTRVDLTQLEDTDNGRNVPITPQQISPTTEQPGLVINRSIDEHDISVPASTESQINVGENTDLIIMPVMRTCIDGQENDQREIIINSELTNETDDRSKRLEETGTSGSAGGEEDVIDTDIEGSEEVNDETVENDSKDDNREAEASPSSNTRQRTMAAAAAAACSLMCTMRGATARRSARTTFRTTRGTRPTPIVWDNQSSRGQNIVRGHAIRGPSSESTRVRGARGRRMRSKYPYNY